MSSATIARPSRLLSTVPSAARFARASSASGTSFVSDCAGRIAVDYKSKYSDDCLLQWAPAPRASRTPAQPPARHSSAIAEHVFQCAIDWLRYAVQAAEQRTWRAAQPRARIFSEQLQPSWYMHVGL